MKRTWLITDTHFNHNKLHMEGWRPADFHQRILDNWRALVSPEDTVYHLGDVIMGRASELAVIMASLPGTKYLVRGNHDLQPTEWYLRRGFDFVATGILRHEVWLTHRPAETLPSGALLNVHGHLHDRVDKRGLETWTHNKLLALEFTDYKPVEWDAFIDSDSLAERRRELKAGYAALDAAATNSDRRVPLLDDELKVPLTNTFAGLGEVIEHQQLEMCRALGVSTLGVAKAMDDDPVLAAEASLRSQGVAV